MKRNKNHYTSLFLLSKPVKHKRKLVGTYDSKNYKFYIDGVEIKGFTKDIEVTYE